MCYVYVQSHSGWDVGFYDPNSRFVVESTHASKEAAAKRVNYLNGGTDVNAINALAFNYEDRP